MNLVECNLKDKKVEIEEIFDYLKMGYSVPDISTILASNDINLGEAVIRNKINSYKKIDPVLYEKMVKMISFINKVRSVKKDTILHLPNNKLGGFVDYKAVSKDTIFSIAQKFRIKPNDVRIEYLKNVVFSFEKDEIDNIIELSSEGYIDSGFANFFIEQEKEYKKYFNQVYTLIICNYSLIEIAFILKINYSKLKDIISLLNDKTSIYYDENLYKFITDKDNELVSKYEEDIGYMYDKFRALECTRSGDKISNYCKSNEINAYVSYCKASNVLRYILDKETGDVRLACMAFGLSSTSFSAVLDENDSHKILRKILNEDEIHQIKKLISDYKKNCKSNECFSINNRKKYEVIDDVKLKFYLLVLLTFRIKICNLSSILPRFSISSNMSLEEKNKIMTEKEEFQKTFEWNLDRKIKYYGDKLYHAYVYNSYMNDEGNIEDAKAFMKEYMKYSKLKKKCEKNCSDYINLSDLEFSDKLNDLYNFVCHEVNGLEIDNYHEYKNLLIEIKRREYVKKLRALKDFICDKKVEKILRKSSLKNLTDDERNAIINYRLKYASKLADNSGCDIGQFEKFCTPEQKKLWDNVNTFNLQGSIDILAKRAARKKTNK